MKKLLFTLSLLLLLTCAKEDSQAPNTPPSQITRQYTLSVSAGDGGSVSTTGGSFNAGTQVSITATPNAGYSFSGWSNGSTANPLTVTLNSNTSITANFEVLINSYTLTVSAGEGGIVSSEGGEYEEGTEVTISAVADSCFNFSQWSDGETSSERIVTVNSNIGITAEFVSAMNEIDYNLVRLKFPCALNNASEKPYNETNKYKVSSYGWLNISNRETHNGYYYPTVNNYHQPGYFYTVAGNYATGDFNNDGLDDIVIQMGTFPHTIERNSRFSYAIFINNGDGSMTYDHDAFIDPSANMQHGAYRTISADLNNDGFLDIVSVGSGVSVVSPDGNGVNIWQRVPLLFNTGNGKFVDASNNIEGQEDGISVVRGMDYGHHISAGDVDGDGDIDLYVASALLINDGYGNFSNKMDDLPFSLRPIQDSGQGFIMSSVIADFNNDGIDDIFASYADSANRSQQPNEGYTGVYSISQNGNPSYIESDIGYLSDSKYGINNTKFNSAVAYDINLDGFKDIIVSVTRGSPYYEGRALQVFLNVENSSTGKRKFESADYLLPDESSMDEMHGEGQLKVIDINNDGILDIVHSVVAKWNEESYGLSFYLNNNGNLVLFDMNEFAFMSQEQIPGKENWGLNGFNLLKAMPINLDNSGWIDYISTIESGLGEEGGGESIFYSVLSKD